MRLLFFTLFTIQIMLGTNLESLLEEYEDSSKRSLETLNEKMGHVAVYTQKELDLMQYEKLSDVLKELPLNNFNTNRMGLSNLSLGGTKTDANGFFRLYINDHEVSSLYMQSPSLGWIDIPISLIKHIEVYYGEGSFTLGNETGIQFIRVYTKDAQKENGTELYSAVSNKSSNSQSITHSTFNNDWSFLIHGTNQNNFYSVDYNKQEIKNKTNQQYLFLNFNNPNNNIDIGYTNISKDEFMGYSTDLTPNDGGLESENLFINMNNYFLDDKSLKTSFSLDINELQYEEKNDQGLFVVPVLDLANMGGTMPKEYYQDLKFTKFNSALSKEFFIQQHSIFTAINFQHKKYEVKNRYATNFANTTTSFDHFNDFEKENIYSFLFQEDYKVTDKLHLIANYKLDKYKRDGNVVKDATEYLYRVGSIYLPTEDLGFKVFYTKSYIPPSFYNAEFINKNFDELKTQQYKYFTIEGAYTYNNSRFSIEYYNTHIDDFIYYTPIGFINVEDKIKTNGFIFDYTYTFNNNDKLKINYYTTRLNQTANNTTDGGYVKYMGEYEKISYFASLIYKEAYRFVDLKVKDSYNLNLGLTYHHTKNLSFGLKGTNLLDKSTKSLATDRSINTTTAYEDYDRNVTFHVRWLF